jgi:uncharacterized protein
MKNLPIPNDKIADFCRQNYIRRLAFFGSVLRDDFNQTSDVDVLVEFSPNHIPGFEFFRMQEELAEILKRPVDLHTPKSLSRYFRDQVMAEAELEYEEG